MNKSILITAHPRSGTHFIARLLNSMGYNCAYEKRNPNGFTASWKHIVDGYFEPPCPEQEIKCNFDKIIHQVRHPLKVIASSTTLWTMSMNYINKYTWFPDPIINKNQSILNCMISWLEWNKLIEEKAIWRYKIEDLTISKVQKQWFDILEIPYKPLKNLNPSNTRNHIDLSWDILWKISPIYANEVKRMAEHYGYTT